MKYFRNVGSHRHEPDDEEFIEMKEFLFKPDAALLLCSDGLSDLLTAAEMNEIIEQFDGDAEETAVGLVDAANDAGGKDNITAVFVAGSEFLGHNSPAMSEARARHAVTRKREQAPDGNPGLLSRLGRLLISRMAFLVYGFAIGVVLALVWR
jgi:hypothetical protein